MNELKAIHKTIIVCFFLGTIAGLQALGRNTETFVTVGLLVLAGVGFAIGKIEAVQKQADTLQKQTNGSQENLVRVIEEQGKRAEERMEKFTQILASLPPVPITINGTYEEKPADLKGGEHFEESVGTTR